MITNRLPEVSLLTSWHISNFREQKNAPRLESLEYALESQFRLLDLYFLNKADIPWYLQKGNVVGIGVEDTTPLKFAADLTPEHIQRIADALSKQLAESYSGRKVGARPRFAALATFWPLLSLPYSDDAIKQEWRDDSIRAVRNSLYLSAQLGCKYVEIVGGAAFSYSDRNNPEKEPEESAREFRENRLNRLAEGLIEIFAPPFCRDSKISRGDDREDAETCLFHSTDSIPYICLEIEPGEPFLIRDVASFLEVRLALKKLRDTDNSDRVDLLLGSNNRPPKLLLNVDVAHMMLTEGDGERSGAEVQLGAIEGEGKLQRIGKRILDENGKIKRLEKFKKEWIGHFHFSDHARTHAADLCPGTYHFHRDFEPWLKLAKTCAENYSHFSGVVAVELEGCSDILEAARAVGKTRRWLELIQDEKSVASKPKSKRTSGALLVADIVGSTDLGRGDDREYEDLIERAVSEISACVHRRRGSVFSFTGDGVVAFFEEDHFIDDFEASLNAYIAWIQMREAISNIGTGEQKPDLRASIHYGEALAPKTGKLAGQLIGPDVVASCRLCDSLKLAVGGTADPQPPLIGLTHKIWGKLVRSKSKVKEYLRDPRLAKEVSKYFSPAEQKKWKMLRGTTFEPLIEKRCDRFRYRKPD